MAINQGQPQPVYFFFGEPLHLTDSNGVTMTAKVLDIVGRSAMLEYRGA